MATTTTHFTAEDVVFHLDNAAGTLTDIQGSSNSVSVNSTRTATAKVNVFGGSPIVGVGARTYSISAKIILSTATDEAWDIVKNWWFGSSHTVARSFQIDSPDATSGSDRYTGECKLVDLPILYTAGEGKPIELEFTLEVDGDLTHAEIA